MESLVTELKQIDNYNFDLESARMDLNRQIGWHVGLPGYRSFKVAPEDIPVIDILSCQSDALRQRIVRETPNYTLLGAMEGGQSVTDALYNASQINTGLRRFLPRRKDEKHNRRVLELQELLSNLSDDSLIKDTLHAKGTFSPSAPLNFFLYGTGGTAAGGGILAGLNDSPSIAGGMILGGLFMGISTGLAGLATVSAYSNNKLPWENAEYLDNKIQELDLANVALRDK